MLLKDIRNLVMDNVVIYRGIGDGEFEDLYRGKPETIPEELLRQEVRTIGGKRKGVIDIKVH